ncbi:MAG: hypothetical protein OXJ62_05125, partial [Spirochaetaceae bacterium]|nr:hypothetical protein [Spirochaetaceae bacterium]
REHGGGVGGIVGAGAVAAGAPAPGQGPGWELSCAELCAGLVASIGGTWGDWWASPVGVVVHLAARVRRQAEPGPVTGAVPATSVADLVAAGFRVRGAF